MKVLRRHRRVLDLYDAGLRVLWHVGVGVQPQLLLHLIQRVLLTRASDSDRLLFVLRHVTARLLVIILIHEALLHRLMCRDLPYRRRNGKLERIADVKLDQRALILALVVRILKAVSDVRHNLRALFERCRPLATFLLRKAVMLLLVERVVIVLFVVEVPVTRLKVAATLPPP